MTERFIRHGNYLTHVYIIEDPVYLTEPLIRTNGFQLDDQPGDAAVSLLRRPSKCRATRARSRTPAGRRIRILEEYATKNKLPQAAMRGGSADGAAGVHEDPGRRERSAGSGRAHTSVGAAGPGPAPAVRSMHVQGNVWMLVGAGVQRRGADRRRRRARRRHDARRRRRGDGRRDPHARRHKPIRWIINTHAHADHIGGNLRVAEAGESIIAGNFVGQAGAERPTTRRSSRTRTSSCKWQEPSPPVPVHAMPTDTFFVNEFELFFNGEAVQLIHVPNAHTDGDVHGVLPQVGRAGRRRRAGDDELSE